MLGLSNEESELVKNVINFLDSQDQNESTLAKQRFECLTVLGDAISRYPSVRE